LTGQNTAVRVVPLRAALPWWTLWICGWTAFLGLILKLSSKIRKFREVAVGTVVLVMSAFPAQYYGWTQIAYPVMYWGAGITVAGIVLLWFAPALHRRSDPHVPEKVALGH